jgi:hypothetical protein
MLSIIKHIPLDIKKQMAILLILLLLPYIIKIEYFQNNDAYDIDYLDTINRSITELIYATPVMIIFSISLYQKVKAKSMWIGSDISLMYLPLIDFFKGLYILFNSSKIYQPYKTIFKWSTYQEPQEDLIYLNDGLFISIIISHVSITIYSMHFKGRKNSSL